jgi:4-amino-4-deoxy-L-arabinose transferase-like glycosyltransferase
VAARPRAQGAPAGGGGSTFFRRLLWIALAGAVLRAAYVVVLAPALTPGGDWRFFAATAGELAAGNGYRISRPMLDPVGVRPVATRPTALHPPAYPAALALWSHLGGGGELAGRLLGAIFGFGTIVAAGTLARRLADPRAGLVAAALAATSPALIGADGALMSETLFVLLVALAVLAAYGLRSRPAAPRAVLLGAVVGLAALTRSEAVLLVPLLIAPSCWRLPQRAWRLLAIALASSAAVVLPWTLRNRLVFGTPILISTNACGVIAGANCPPVYGGEQLGAWELTCLAPPSGNEAVDAERWCADGLRFAREHATRLPTVVAVRFLRTWDLWPASFWTVGEGRLKTVARLGKLWLLVVAAAGAVGALRLRARGAELWPLLAPLAMVSLAGMLGWGLPRLQAGGFPSIVVLAAVACAAAVGAGIGAGVAAASGRERGGGAPSPL